MFNASPPPGFDGYPPRLWIPALSLALAIGSVKVFKGKEDMIPKIIVLWIVWCGFISLGFILLMQHLGL